MTAYPVQPEVILTAAQMRLMARLVKIATDKDIEKLIECLELVTIHGSGEARVLIYRGHPRFIKAVISYDTRER